MSILGVPEEFRPEFYMEFCVRQIGTKSPSWSLCVPVVPQNDLFKGIWPPHARRSGPLVETPGQAALMLRYNGRRVWAERQCVG